MSKPPDRGLRIVTGLTLVILAVASAVLLGASFVAAYSEDTVFMLLAVGPQYVGMALLARRFGRHTGLSVVMLGGTATLAGLGTFVYGSLWAQPVVPGVENYSGCVVMLLGLLLWIFVAVIGVLGMRWLNTDRVARLCEIWLERPPGQRCEQGLPAFYDELRRVHPDLLPRASVTDPDGRSVADRLKIELAGLLEENGGGAASVD